MLVIHNSFGAFGRLQTIGGYFFIIFLLEVSGNKKVRTEDGKTFVNWLKRIYPHKL